MNEELNCPARQAIELLQEKWVLHIVRQLLDGPRGFNDLSRAVGGCNPATLAQRLEHLEDVGLVEKTVHSTMPPRTSYALSPAGVALEHVIREIDRWARNYLTQPETPPATAPDVASRRQRPPAHRT